MDVILSISFRITAEIEIRKHKLKCCVLLRGVVSAKALYLRLSTNQVFILNGVVATRSNRVHILLRTCFFPSSIFFSFLFCFVCLFVLLLCFLNYSKLSRFDYPFGRGLAPPWAKFQKCYLVLRIKPRRKTQLNTSSWKKSLFTHVVHSGSIWLI